MVIADARNFLLTTAERYDVIISEPSNPWISGVATLFTREFFDLARQRLRPGGLMIQWVHSYNLLAENFQMIVKTFRTAFPATSIWQPGSGDFLLVGRTGPLPIDLDVLKARYEASPPIRNDLARIGVRGWSGPLGYFLLAETEAARFADGAALNTDDRLSLEFSAPRALYLDTTFDTGQQLARFRVSDLPEVTPASSSELQRPEVRAWIGLALLGRGAPNTAARFLAPGAVIGITRPAPEATPSR